MKTNKFTRLFLIVILALSLTSCGDSKKKNKVNSTKLNQNIYNLPYGSADQNLVNQVMAQFNCSEGSQIGQPSAAGVSLIGPRLETAPVLHASYSGSATTISGPFIPGALPQSGTSKLYVGYNQGLGDLLIVSKITSGNQVLGFNIYPVLCSNLFRSYLTGQTQEVISDRLQPTNFQFTSGITITEKNYCAYGGVDRAQGYFSVQNSPSQFYMAFAPTSCRVQ